MSNTYEDLLVASVLLAPANAKKIIEEVTLDAFSEKARAVISSALNVLPAIEDPSAEDIQADLNARGLFDKSLENYMLKLLKQSVNPDKIKNYLELFRRSYFESVGQSILKEALDGIEEGEDPVGVFSRMQSKIEKLLAGHSIARAVNAKELVDLVIDYIDSNDQGWLTGFPTLDSATAGIFPGDLFVLAGRQSHGKTQLSLNIAKNLIDEGIPVGLISLEMFTTQLAIRLLGLYAGINYLKIRKKELNDIEIQTLLKAGAKIAKLPVFVNEVNSFAFSKVEQLIRTGIIEHGWKVVFIDYLQKMYYDGDVPTGNEASAIGVMTTALKNIAKQYGIGVVVLSQLSRNNELRGSGRIGEDADCVVVIKKNEEPQREESPENVFGIDMSEFIGNATVSIEKCRNGETTEFPVKFDKPTGKMVEIIV
jgi:replicative DNA helicase